MTIITRPTPPIYQEDAEAIGQHRQCALRQELKRRQREASQYIITSARLITPVLVRQGLSHFNMIHYLAPRPCTTTPRTPRPTTRNPLPTTYPTHTIGQG